MNKRRLFLIHNHKNFSGAARSLSETIISLENKVNFIVICPKGSSSIFFKSLGIEVIEVMFIPRFNHFEIGFYKGLRWLMIIREIIALIYFFFFLIFLKIKHYKIEKFHLNELELSIVAPILKLFFDANITSHLRCPLETKKGKFRYSFLSYICKNFLNKIIAIDYDCYKTSPIKKKTSIVYNGINNKNLILKKKKKNILTFGFIGNFIKRKGIYEVLEVFKEMKNYNIKLICVGKSHQKNRLLNFLNFERNFDDYLNKNKILNNKNIKILPIMFDLKKFYSSIDIIIFPGFMNAVGRPVIEGSLLKKPSIIALKKHNLDTAKKNNCLIFKPGDLTSLKKKVLYFYKNKSKIKKMGSLAFKNAKKNFDINKNSKKLYKIIWN